MPDMTGHELVRRLATVDSAVNVLFMSGQGPDGIEASDLAQWSTELLPKPFRPDRLLRAVRAARWRAADAEPWPGPQGLCDRPSNKMVTRNGTEKEILCGKHDSASGRKQRGLNSNGNPNLGVPQVQRREPDIYCSSEVRILILDDDPAVCRVIQAALSNSDFKIDAVSDPRWWRPPCAGEPYHLIILDYVIPGLESEQVLDWVREYQPDASIIVVTGLPVGRQRPELPARPHLRLPDQAVPDRAAAADRDRAAWRARACCACRRRPCASRWARPSASAARRSGLTLAQMAQRTGVSLGYLSQIELGKNSASIETLYRISLGLGIKMADLFQTVQTPV